MPPQKVSDRSDVGDCEVSGDYSEDDEMSEIAMSQAIIAKMMPMLTAVGKLALVRF